MPSTQSDRIDGLTTSVAVKAPCRTITTVNNTLTGLQTIGGVVLVEGDRVVVNAQTDTKQNGLYNASSGTWTRTLDFDGERDAVQGSIVMIAAPAITPSLWRLTTVDPVLFGSSAIAFAQIPGVGTGPSLSANQVWTGFNSYTQILVAAGYSITGAGNNFVGDFTNATIPFRNMFQTNVVGGVSELGVIPNGAGGQAAFVAFDSSGAVNTHVARMGVGPGGVVLQSYNLVAGVIGGTQQPLGITVGGTTVAVFNEGANPNVTLGSTTDLIFTGTGRRLYGDFSNLTVANRLLLQSSTVNGASRVGIIPNGTQQTAELGVINDSAAANGSIILITIDGSPLASLTAGAIGAGTNPALAITVGGAERARFLTSGELCIATTAAPSASGTKLRVNGLVQIDNACAFKVDKNGVNQAFVDAAAAALVTFSTKRFDQDTSFNTGTGQLTPKSGKYYLCAYSTNAGSVDQANWAIWIYKNGAVHLTGDIQTCSGATVTGVGVSGVVDATGADTFEVRIQSANGGGTGMTASGLANDTYFTGFRIG